MALFAINKDKLNSIKEEKFKLEKHIQQLTEDNLSMIFGLDFIKSEFSLHDFRIDSLAFDKESNSFVIIEYKRDKNYSVIDQGYTYLSLMLKHQEKFILEYMKKYKKYKTYDEKKDIDWRQSRIMFISPSFTIYQKGAVNFKDLPIELWEIKKYTNQTVSYNQIQKDGAKESIKTISRKDGIVDSVSKEIKAYTEEENLSKANDEIKELYEKFKISILNFDDIKVKPNKLYISFVKNSTNVSDYQILSKSIKITINLKKGVLDDPKEITKDGSNIGKMGNGDYQIKIANDDDIEYILSLIKQSYLLK
jgi:predicted transport protein